MNKRQNVFINEVQASIAGHKSSNLLAILDELSTHALPDGRVGLLGLDATAKRSWGGGSWWGRGVEGRGGKREIGGDGKEGGGGARASGDYGCDPVSESRPVSSDDARRVGG